MTGALALVMSCSIDDRSVVVRSGGGAAGDSGGPTFEGCSLGGEDLGPWSCVKSNTLQSLRGVWGTGPEDAWAVGAQGSIVHWNGSVWSDVTSTTTQDLSSVWGDGPDDVWAVGHGGTILHWNGSRWSASAIEGLSPDSSAETFNSVWGSGSRDVHAVGDRGWDAHWDGTSWEAGKPVTFQNTRNLYGVWGSAPNDIWIVGQFCVDLELDPSCGGGTVLHSNGANWSAPPTTPTPPLYAAWGSGSGDIWAVGDDTRNGRVLILHSNGSTWADVSPAEPASGGGHAVWGSGPDDVWVVGFGPFNIIGTGDAVPSGNILHFDGAAWTAAVTNSAVQFNGVWGSGPDDVWAVADGGMILHYRAPQ